MYNYDVKFNEYNISRKFPKVRKREIFIFHLCKYDEFKLLTIHTDPHWSTNRNIIDISDYIESVKSPESISNENSSVAKSELPIESETECFYEIERAGRIVVTTTTKNGGLSEENALYQLFTKLGFVLMHYI